jgi:uncharacterized metal-binding protein YceD (DUF177 family)
MDKSNWIVPVSVADVPESGLHVELEADEATRAELASLAGLRTLPRLVATFDVARRSAGLRVTGHVSATVGQTCVVTLEPMENAVEEDIDLVFREGEAGEATVAPSGENPESQPETLLDGKIDLGAVASEFLMLGIDPYPRKPGAEFAAPKVDTDGAHPFAALAALKKDPGASRS